MNFERYGLFILFIVLASGVLDGPINLLMQSVSYLLTIVIGWPFMLLGLL